MDNTIISKLVQIQARDKLSDKKMAKRLGCSRALWQLTRTEKTPVNAKIIKGIARNFPELHTALLVFLSHDVKESELIADKTK